MNLKQALTQARALLEANRIPDSSLEAEILLRHILRIDRVQLYTDFGRELESGEAKAYESLVYRRIKGEPSAYITARREFYGLDFYVDPSVLIPRPETELLVGKAIELAKRRNFSIIADIGTGSGAIAIVLAAKLSGVKIYASDISEAALKIARLNAERHGVAKKIRFLQGDLLECLPERVDLIVANLPYVKESDIPGSLSFEPRLALSGGADGLEKIYRLCGHLRGKLNFRGALLLELGVGQAGKLSNYLQSMFPSSRIEINYDPAHIARVLGLLDIERIGMLN